MRDPSVTFIVPCYKLAHLLAECINSILAQTYSDFEVLIMDDCSPDSTPEIARSFRDPRVTHIRNEPNLGHLKNYNKGIALARGRYVWLISADDYLLRPYVLQRYVQLLDDNPRVGFTFCPGVGIGHDAESHIHGWVSHAQAVHGNNDRIFSGHQLLKKLLTANTIVAASGLVRRANYQKRGVFPLDMPWAGDWYLWCLFALYSDIGYFAEPMVAYRDHDLSMTKKLWSENVVTCCDEDVRVPWAIKAKAAEAGFRHVERNCLQAIAQIYARSIVSKRYRMSSPSLDLQQFEKSLYERTQDEAEREWIRVRVFAGMGSEYYWKGDRLLAKQFYEAALKRDPLLVGLYVKRLLLWLGGPGERIWKWLQAYA